jgi:Mg2+-importing ATPase
VFLDPPKITAGTTIQALAASGVSVKVLTGDNELVARHVFGEIGIPVRGVLSGEELNRLSQEALLGQLPRVNLFCRVNPQQKLRVLQALKRTGHVVGFMGDGINDAPSLHAADVGISVDGAADVAREAADLILLEHDLSVVQQAVMHGRRTVRNVSKYILMGSSSNFGNMFSMAGAAVFLPFLPMLPTQVLLNNLLYDTSQIAIPFDDVDPEDTALPVRWDMRLIEHFMLVFGPLSSVFDFITFYMLLRVFEAGEALFHTGWFIESLATQVLVVFAIRTRRPLLRSRPHFFSRQSGIRHRWARRRAAVQPGGRMARFGRPLDALLPVPSRCDRRVSGTCRSRQARLLQTLCETKLAGDQLDIRIGMLVLRRRSCVVVPGLPGR